MNTIGERIKVLRIANRLTSEELSEMIGFTPTDTLVEKMETNKMYPSRILLGVLAKVLNVTERYLLTGELDRLTYTSMKSNDILSDIYGDDITNSLDEIFTVFPFVNITLKENTIHED